MHFSLEHGQKKGGARNSVIRKVRKGILTELVLEVLTKSTASTALAASIASAASAALA